MPDNAISDLTEYAVEKGLITEEDRVFTHNALIDAFHKTSFAPDRAPRKRPLSDILAELCDKAAGAGLIDGESVTERDLFDTRLMGLLTPRPGEVIRRFRDNYKISPRRATDEYYKFSGDTNYIRRDRIEKDVKWSAETPYGTLDITINLSKPEKDPKAIAAALHKKNDGYPSCALCRENEGYAGRMDAAARQNHRIIPMTLAGEEWYFQYSPYVYYNEHCIVLSGKHTPMRLSRRTFERLLGFVEHIPHYFLGSNADLPIVGGSILTHDHFQGGHYTFPMERAEIVRKIVFKGYEDVAAGIVKWPLSVIRLRCRDKERLVDLSVRILAAWRGYSDPDAFVFAETDGTPHNTITPIARRRGEAFEIDLVLRNNLTTPEHPLGVYHPHAELHHIKKENIGLIEVMGLAVLPARLKKEMEKLAGVMVRGEDPRADEQLAKHADWAEDILSRRAVTADNAETVLKEEVGQVFCKVLEHAGVYKNEQAFMRFIDEVNGKGEDVL